MYRIAKLLDMVLFLDKESLSDSHLLVVHQGPGWIVQSMRVPPGQLQSSQQWIREAKQGSGTGLFPSTALLGAHYYL